jgi:hypothetical protein
MIADGEVAALPPQARVLFLSFSRTAVTQVIGRASGVVGPLISRIEVVLRRLRVADHQRLWRRVRIPPAAAHPVRGGTQGPRRAHRDALCRPDPDRSHHPGKPCRRQPLRPAPFVADLRRVPRHRRPGMALPSDNRPRRPPYPAWRRQPVHIRGDKDIDPDARIAEALALPGAKRIDLPAPATATHREYCLPRLMQPASGASATTRSSTPSEPAG